MTIIEFLKVWVEGIVERILRFVQVEDQRPTVFESISGHFSKRLLVVVSIFVLQHKSLPEIKDMANSIAGNCFLKTLYVEFSFFRGNNNGNPVILIAFRDSLQNSLSLTGLNLANKSTLDLFIPFFLLGHFLALLPEQYVLFLTHLRVSQKVIFNKEVCLERTF